MPISMDRALLLVLLMWGRSVRAAVAPEVGYNQFLLFPNPGSSMGVFFALSVPLDSAHHDVSVSYNFEANYALPNNKTALSDLEEQYGFKRSHQRGQRSATSSHTSSTSRTSTRTLRDLQRSDVYSMITGSIARAGLPGRACLLRAVCEASEWPMAEGLLGNFLTVLLTPSTSQDDDLHPDFHAAERRGRRGADCALHYGRCPTSLLGLLTEQ